MQRRRAARFNTEHTFDANRYVELNLTALFGHLLAAARQGNATGFLRSGRTGTGFFHGQFQAACITIKQIAFFHVTTICHGETSFDCYSGQLITRYSAYSFV
jgi:hypothetical protein